jgi:TonB family protein
MTPALTPLNLAIYALQVGAIVLAGAWLPRLLRLSSPRARLAYWRALLLVCLLLPAIQPLAAPAPLPGEEAPTAVTGQQAGSMLGTPAPRTPTAAQDVPREPAKPWPIGAIIATVLVAGISARLAWLALGMIGLARMRRSATPLLPRPAPVDEAAALVGADAQFLVAPVQHPVTFGALRPVVLVPEAFREYGESEQKAIACHELIHVRRHDWLRTVSDEIVRAVAWFHPAVWWLVDQIHLSREQLVDREVVTLTGSRKPYVDALLRLASPTSVRGLRLRPVSLFLTRAHLPERIALLIEEAPMSKLRLAASLATMAIVLLIGGRLVVGAIPLQSAPDGISALVPGAESQVTSSGMPVTPSGLTIPRRIVYVPPVAPPEVWSEGASGRVHLSVRLDAYGIVQDVTPTRVRPNPPSEAWNRTLVQAAVDAAMQWRFEPHGRDSLTLGFAVWFEPAERGGHTGSALLVGGAVPVPRKIHDVVPTLPEQTLDPVDRGVVIIESIIDELGNVTDARVLRSVAPVMDKAALEAVRQWKYEPASMERMITVTVAFARDRALGIAAAQAEAAAAAAAAARAAAGTLPPGSSVSLAAKWPNATRVGGDTKAPQKVKDVRPTYPPVAEAARVQGVVIVEALIGEDGRVQDVRILRSIPLLDQAALEAVLQWEFTPTLLNGVPVPVIMTATVNFTLSDRNEMPSAAGVAGGIVGGIVGGVSAPPPPPPPPPPPAAGVAAGGRGGVGGGVAGGVASGAGGIAAVGSTRAVIGGVASFEKSWWPNAARVGGNITQPQKLKDVRPVYPEVARNARVQGVVIVEALIGEDGRVQDARILRSILLLDQAALEAVLQWEFTPTLLEGIPVPVVMTMTVNFVLD